MNIWQFGCAIPTNNRTEPRRSGLYTARRLSFAVALSMLVTACTNQDLYEAIQQNRLQACEEIPIPQQAQCKARYQVDYEDYKRERDQAGDQE